MRVMGPRCEHCEARQAPRSMSSAATAPLAFCLAVLAATRALLNLSLILGGRPGLGMTQRGSESCFLGPALVRSAPSVREASPLRSRPATPLPGCQKSSRPDRGRAQRGQSTRPFPREQTPCAKCGSSARSSWPHAVRASYCICMRSARAFGRKNSRNDVQIAGWHSIMIISSNCRRVTRCSHHSYF